MASERDKARQNARRRGKAFEANIAGRFGGHVYTGEDGDVEARGYRIECKHRSGFRTKSNELRDWLDQIKRYEKINPGKPFALAVTGGIEMRGETWVAVRLDEFLRLTDGAT